MVGPPDGLGTGATVARACRIGLADEVATAEFSPVLVGWAAMAALRPQLTAKAAPVAQGGTQG